MANPCLLAGRCSTFQVGISMELALSSSVQYIPRVGPKMAKKLDILGIKTVEDLLYYIPFRYNDYSLVSPIGRVQPGETVTIRGEVISIKNAFTKTGKKLQQAKISDESGTLDVIWFNQMYLTRIIKPGQTLSLSGKVDWFGRSLVMISPEYERYTEQSLHTGRLVPVYSETEGLSSKWLRGRIAYAIDQCIDQIEDYIPRSIHEYPGLQSAIKTIHFPGNQREASLARKRLAFDELFLLMMRAKREKQKWQTTKKAHTLNVVDTSPIMRSLPFDLTSDQKRTIDEILDDFKKPYAMNRLLEGDVGSGKTVVSAIAMYIMFKNHLQSVLMAPTQILAEQHFETLSKLLSPLEINVQLKTGSHTHHDASFDILVGTHALLSKSITFNNVGLIVIDEQQRFGVHQRALLSQKTSGKDLTAGRQAPHMLTMTATPIPRTIAQTLYGNLDLSVITQMPKGRQIVKTWVVPKEKRASAYNWIKHQVKETGGQVFIICPLIEESETLASVKSVKAEYQLLKTVFSPLTLGLLHGRMKAKDKSEALDRFRTRKDAILLATPVVEVGIDIPNATIMLIEAADRFGLAQLHQLRGRVGRRNQQSYCLLFTETDDDAVTKRLKSMETMHNGPELAELDLKLRGPGEMFGTKQHGLFSLRIAQFSDTALLGQTKKTADDLFEIDPRLSNHPLLRTKLEKGTMEST